MKMLLAGAVLALAVAGGIAVATAGSEPVVPIEGVDRVVVDKSDRELFLMRGEEVLRGVPIALGDAPEGHKRREGDERTPEGLYTLDWRNPNSAYHLSIHVSYPNEEDERRAAARGEDPGGMIMIHGQPNGFGAAARLLQLFDWTDGCIAVSNDHMDLIWASVPNGTPIEIRP